MKLRTLLAIQWASIRRGLFILRHPSYIALNSKGPVFQIIQIVAIRYRERGMEIQVFWSDKIGLVRDQYCVSLPSRRGRPELPEEPQPNDPKPTKGLMNIQIERIIDEIGRRTNLTPPNREWLHQQLLKLVAETELSLRKLSNPVVDPRNDPFEPNL